MSRRAGGAAPPMDMSLLTHFPFSERCSLIDASMLKAPRDDVIIKPSGIKLLAGCVAAAHRAGRPVVLGMGAHAVKLGLGPYITDLIERGIISAVAMNGACAFHDMELAVFGATSENVASELSAGRFGFADEPARFFNSAVAIAYDGLGAALAQAVADAAPASRARFSILATAASKGIPLTVHVAVGTDVVHMHPTTDGAATGAATFIDFRRFLTIVSELAGGVYINLGSAVLMPEIFLKAVSVALHLGVDLSGMTTANLDMLSHYRPLMNVIKRPPGAGIDIRARHEETVPALRACILSQLRAS